MIRAVGALLGYVEETQRSALGNITELSVYETEIHGDRPEYTPQSRALRDDAYGRAARFAALGARPHKNVGGCAPLATVY